MRIRPRATLVFTKAIQRQTLDCLSRRHGQFLCFTALFFITISALQFGKVVLQQSMTSYATAFSFAGTFFHDQFCLPFPIDVVYTWVNGSDPRLIQQMRSLMQELHKKRRQDRAAPSHASQNHQEEIGDRGCSFQDCVPADVVLIKGLPVRMGLKELSDIDNMFQSASHLFHISYRAHGAISVKLKAVVFDASLPRALFQRRLVYRNKNLTLTEGRKRI